MPKKPNPTPKATVIIGKIPKKKGRPLKHPIVVIPQQEEFSREDQDTIKEVLRKVLRLRRVENLRQLYQQLQSIVKYIYDSIDYGELNLSQKPTQKYLEERLVKQFR